MGIPRVIIPVLREHLSIYVKDEPGALAFPGAMGGPLRRGNFNKMSAWDLMARMGHDSERAAMIYQHEARGADQSITRAIDTHVQAEQASDEDDGEIETLAPVG